MQNAEGSTGWQAEGIKRPTLNVQCSMQKLKENAYRCNDSTVLTI
jgi:hypothetical protein